MPSHLLRLPARLPRTIHSHSTSPSYFHAQSHVRIGRPPAEHPSNETDTANVQHEAVKDAREERTHQASGEAAGKKGSVATGESSGMDKSKEIKKEFPEAPGPLLGMEDERGGKGR